MNEELGRRAMACARWRWMPGMLSRCSTDTRRAVYRWLVGLDTRHFGIVCIVEDKHGRPCRNVATLQPGPDDLPDLEDPATLGCLLALVREAWASPDIFGLTFHCDGGSCVEINDRHFYGTSMASALVAALEAAP